MRNQIIIIDDDEAVRDSISAYLECIGYNANSYASAHQFLQTGNLKSVCCFIVDVQMPVMTGVDFLEVIHKFDPSIPVILISGNISPSTRSRAKRAGVKAIFEKPFDQDALLKVLDGFYPIHCQIAKGNKIGNCP